MKKIISVILTLCVLGYAISIIALADAATTCGDNLSWHINEDTETLYIEGNGEMYDYTDYGQAPWYNVRSKVSNIKFSNTVTHIGAFAFSKMKFETLVIPANIVSIGEEAFYGNYNLKKVFMENGKLESVGKSAFESCIALKDLYLPESAVIINDYAFKNTAIENLVIPKGTVSVGKYSFQLCDKLTNITINSNMKSIGKSAFSGINNLVSLTMNGSVEKIGDSAFANCAFLSKVMLNEGIEAICDKAFLGCFRIMHLNLPESLTYIGDTAFCGIGIEELHIPEKVSIIGCYAFSKCIDLKSVYISNGVKQILNGAFKNTGIESIFIPESVENIEDIFDYDCSTTIYGMFNTAAEEYSKQRKINFIGIYSPVIKNKGFDYIELNEVNGYEYSINGIDWQSSTTFYNLMPLTEYSLYQRIAAINEVAASPFGVPLTVKTFDGARTENDYWEFDNKNKKLTVNGDTYLKDYSSSYNAQEWSEYKNSIDSLVIKNANGSIGSYAFSNMTKLKAVDICEGIGEIKNDAFKNSILLEGIVFPNSLKEIGERAFKNSGISGSLDFKNVTIIGDEAFCNCKKLERIFIKNNTDYIGFNSFGECDLLEKSVFYFDPVFIASNAFNNSTNNFIYSYIDSEIIKYCRNNNLNYICFGDFDANQSINAADIVMMRMFLLKIITGYDSLASDVNGDGMYDIRDLIKLKKMVALI